MKRMLQVCKACQHIAIETDNDAYTVMGVVQEDVANRRYACVLNRNIYAYHSPKYFETMEVPDVCPLIMEQMITGQIR